MKPQKVALAIFFLEREGLCEIVARGVKLRQMVGAKSEIRGRRHGTAVAGVHKRRALGERESEGGHESGW